MRWIGISSRLSGATKATPHGVAWGTAPLWLAAVASTACLEQKEASDTSRAPDADTAIVEVTPEVGSEVEVEVAASDADALADGTSPPDVASEVVYGTPATVACHAGPLGATGVAVFDQKLINMTPVLFDDGKLIGSRARSADVDVAVSDLVQLDLATGVEQIIAPMDDLLMPIDARDGALLYITFSEAQLRMRYLDRTQGASQTLFEGAFGTGASYPALFPQPFGWQRSVRHVERDVAAWREYNESAFGQISVHAMVDGVTAKVWESTEGFVGHDVVLRNGRAAWTFSQGPNALLLADVAADLGAPPREITPDVLDFALTDDAVWWIDGAYSGGPVMRMDLTTGDIAEAYPGPCRYLVAGDTRVVTLCGDGLEGGELLNVGGRPVVLDGVSARVFPVGGESTTDGPTPGVAVTLLAIEGERVVWGEYPPMVITDRVPAGTGISCRSGIGDAWLRLGDVGTGAIETVAEIGQGCWCCHNDGFWEWPDVQLRADGMAWNYPATTPVDNRSNQKAPIGWLLFDQPCAP